MMRLLSKNFVFVIITLLSLTLNPLTAFAGTNPPQKICHGDRSFTLNFKNFIYSDYVYDSGTLLLKFNSSSKVKIQFISSKTRKVIDTITEEPDPGEKLIIDFPQNGCYLKFISVSGKQVTGSGYVKAD